MQSSVTHHNPTSPPTHSPTSHPTKLPPPHSKEKPPPQPTPHPQTLSSLSPTDVPSPGDSPPAPTSPTTHSLPKNLSEVQIHNHGHSLVYPLPPFRPPPIPAGGGQLCWHPRKLTHNTTHSSLRPPPHHSLRPFWRRQGYAVQPPLRASPGLLLPVRLAHDARAPPRRAGWRALPLCAHGEL